MSRIAFLGLGAMGRRMAARLITADHEVTVWNRSTGAAAPLVAAGARSAPTPRAAAQGADIALSMVTDDTASRAIHLGPDGTLAGLAPGALLVETSTLSPAWIADLAVTAESEGQRFLDAPVAGSRPQADAGALIFLAGGSAEDVATFATLGHTMGQKILHAGPTGQGTALKMMVNALLALQAAAMNEILRYAGENGIAPDKAVDMLAEVPVTSPAAAVLGRQIATGAHDPMFTIDLLLKDLAYLLDGAPPMPVMDTVRAAFTSAQTRGLGDRHISAVAA